MCLSEPELLYFKMDFKNDLGQLFSFMHRSAICRFHLCRLWSGGVYDKSDVAQIRKGVYDRVENNVEKVGKCLLPIFLLTFTHHFKFSFSRLLNVRIV